MALTSLKKESGRDGCVGIVVSHQSQTPVFLPLPLAVAGAPHVHRREGNQANWWDFLQCEIFA